MPWKLQNYFVLSLLWNITLSVSISGVFMLDLSWCHYWWLLDIPEQLHFLDKSINCNGQKGVLSFVNFFVPLCRCLWNYLNIGKLLWVCNCMHRKYNAADLIFGVVLRMEWLLSVGYDWRRHCHHTQDFCVVYFWPVDAWALALQIFIYYTYIYIYIDS
jgi:hypothetical protein